MRQSVKVKRSGTYVVDEIGARTAGLVAGTVVELPPSAAERLVRIGAGELVELEQDDAPVSRRSRRKAAEPVAAEQELEAEAVEDIAGGEPAEGGEG